jgi:RecB family endonuclease NucS
MNAPHLEGMEDIDVDATWWRLKAGREGVLEDDWIDRNIVTTGWGNSAPEYPADDPSSFVDSDPSPRQQLSKFLGYHPEGMSDGDVVVVYAPGKGHISGVGKVGEIRFDPEQSFRYLSSEEEEEYMVADHFFIRPIEWFDWGTPVLLTELPNRFQVQQEDQIPTPPTVQTFGTLKSDRDRIEALREAVTNAETISPTEEGFGPEQEDQIQQWIVNNIRQLGGYNPQREEGTRVGRIDVLAETDDGELVIEVKQGRAGDRALGQLVGYLACRQDVNPDIEVQGLLIAEDFTERVKMAVQVVDAVELRQFRVRTSISTV